MSAAADILVQYSFFHWPKYTFTPHDREHLNTFMDRLKRKKRVTIGRYRPVTWIGFNTISLMVSAFLRHARERGALGWDPTISRVMSVALMGALGCHAGEVARSAYYTDTECLLFKHMELHLEDVVHGAIPTLANVVGVVKNSLEKGKRDQTRECHEVHLLPLLDEDQHHLCAISWVLVHALRHGLVDSGGRHTLQGVLDAAMLRSDHKIVWTQPDRPLVNCTSNSAFLNDRPAPTNQITATVKDMGIKAGILARVPIFGAPISPLATPLLSRPTTKAMAENPVVVTGIVHPLSPPGTSRVSPDLRKKRSLTTSKIPGLQHPQHSIHPSAAHTTLQPDTSHPPFRLTSATRKDHTHGMADTQQETGGSPFPPASPRKMGDNGSGGAANGSGGVSNTRLYLADVENHFNTHGTGEITEIKLMNGFGFIEYKDAMDARDVVPDGSEFMGERLVVQFARGSNRPRDGAFDQPRMAPRPRRTVHRMTINGLPFETSWQDLKDFARQSGLDVVYSEVNRERDPQGGGKGYVEYETAADLASAVEKLDNSSFKGSTVRCISDPQSDVPRPRERYRSRSPGYGGRGGGGGGGRGYGAPPPADDYYYDRRGPPRGYSPRRDDYRRRTPPPRGYYEDPRDDRYGPPRRGPPPEEYPPPPRGRYPPEDRYGAPPPPRGYAEPEPYGGANGHGREPYGGGRPPSPRRDGRAYDRGYGGGGAPGGGYW
ncbi:hypothetical protein LTR42_011160 [Elasticomyces elasticus]|nr:hypothetical protein LTR42_011160 [Elasticomyces elasticus]